MYKKYCEDNNQVRLDWRCRISKEEREILWQGKNLDDLSNQLPDAIIKSLKAEREEYIGKAADIPNRIPEDITDLKEKALWCFNERNKLKEEIRRNMEDQDLADDLDVLRPIETDFESFVNYKIEKYGFSRDKALKDIIKSSRKTNDDVNKTFKEKGG